MGKVLNTLSLGMVGGKKKKPAAPERPKVEDGNLRREANQATQDAASKAARGAARARRVSNQVQVGRAGSKTGIRTSLSNRPTRSGLGIN